MSEKTTSRVMSAPFEETGREKRLISEKDNPHYLKKENEKMAAGDDSLVKETDLYFDETLLAHCNCNKSRRIHTLKILARKTF